MRFLLHMMKQGYLDAEGVISALRIQVDSAPPLGQIALKQRLMTVRQVMDVINRQLDEPNKRFGEIAQELGSLKKEQVEQLLCSQAASRMTPEEALTSLGLEASDVLPEYERYAISGGIRRKLLPGCPDRNGVCPMRSDRGGPGCSALQRAAQLSEHATEPPVVDQDDVLPPVEIGDGVVELGAAPNDHAA